ncbi:IF-2B-domain-containing protein [Punctularia strigosozonata HHB-11173 SS5]|uniref:IF-2B-domain-containing protein n=1 Tax=Punctularia strigosozonata (strain HHB-11173) TaxID=741275 RepID=UPI0004417E95|nr:IF-2B-domain-containing protein [Punctularia strigosozonata HHB-11173 SS5]EIN10390.1 IF-2B-domain-containing protein [Punctularia strigosozonata HHB-11173 SS5]
MVVNDPPNNGQSSGQAFAQKSMKQMTKAERRELQEKQRAAKAEKAAAAGAGGGGGKQNQKQQQQQQRPPTLKEMPSRKLSNAVPPTPGRIVRDGRDPAGLADDAAGRARGLRIFQHFDRTKPTSGKGNIHPAIVRLGLQFSQFKISGANARCIATLTAFKTVIQDYVTPPDSTLSRHLLTYLSPQINHLKAARPMSVTMGNAIRQLKLEISSTDIDLPEQDAKDALCQKIDNYIRDRIIIADEVIQDTAGKKIKDGDVVMTYARSSVVEKALLNAHAEGKQFSAIVVDSRPMFEGKRLLRVLSHAGIACTYSLLPSIGSLITETSLVFLGAHSLHSNGAVFSRAGTALVAMMAKAHNVPVVVCCETYKFSEGVVLDSFTRNELAPTGLFASEFPLSKPPSSRTLQNGPNLEILNPLYDLTPPTSITAVVTEVGIIPPNSISSIPLALGRQSV